MKWPNNGCVHDSMPRTVRTHDVMALWQSLVQTAGMPAVPSHSMSRGLCGTQVVSRRSRHPLWATHPCCAAPASKRSVQLASSPCSGVPQQAQAGPLTLLQALHGEGPAGSCVVRADRQATSKWAAQLTCNQGDVVAPVPKVYWGGQACIKLCLTMTPCLQGSEAGGPAGQGHHAAPVLTALCNSSYVHNFLCIIPVP